MSRNQWVIVREGLAATWTSVNPVLARGEIGYETDTGKFKLGVDLGTQWNSLPYGGLIGPQSTIITENFGNGSLGNVTISSGITTLTQDAYYNNLTINGTGQLFTNNYRVFVAGTLDISAAGSGAINNNGFAGNAASGIVGGVTPASQSTGASVGGQGRGAAGGNGSSTITGNNGVNASSFAGPVNGGLGGSGSTGGLGLVGGTAGTGGTAGPNTGGVFIIRRFETELLKGFTLIQGGTGGGGGGGGTGEGKYAGGGGGSGANAGGILAIYANIIARGTNTNPGIFESNGGAGGNGAQTNQSNSITVGGGAGGGGGGGGWIYIAYNTLTGSPIINGIEANGGAGGNGGNGLSLAIYGITRKTTNQGSSWTIVDDFLYSTAVSDYTIFSSTCLDLSGNLYVVGTARDITDTTRWIVRKSTNNGTSWTTIDDFVYTGGTDSEALKCGIDTLGNIYVVGKAKDSVSTIHWITRQSTNNGTSWATIDDYVNTGGTDSEAYTFGTDSAGNVYVGGFGVGTGSLKYWITRQSTNNGTSWATVDTYLYSGGGSANAEGFGKDLLGNIYVCGFAHDATLNYHWITRQSTNNGVTWNTVDDFIYTGGTNSNAVSITIDLLGNIYVSGFGCDVSSVSYRWVTRKSIDNGVTWNTADDYVYPGNTYTIASSSVVDTLGNIYVGGYGDDGVGITHWLVRKSTDNGATWNNVDDYINSSGNNNIASGMGLDSLDNVYAVGYITSTGTTTGGGGAGGSGGSAGIITLFQIPTGIGSSNTGTSGSAGAAPVLGTGGTGGAGGILEENI